MNVSVRPLTANETHAWALVLVFFIVGDMATTALGLHYGAIEANPGGTWLLSRFGLWGGLLLGKTVTVGFTAIIFSISSWEYRYLFLGVLAALGAFATVYNTYIILTITGLQ